MSIGFSKFFLTPGVEPEQPIPPTAPTATCEGDRVEGESNPLSVVPWLVLTHREFSISFIVFIIRPISGFVNTFFKIFSKKK